MHPVNKHCVCSQLFLFGKERTTEIISPYISCVHGELLLATAIKALDISRLQPFHRNNTSLEKTLTFWHLQYHFWVLQYPSLVEWKKNDNNCPRALWELTLRTDNYASCNQAKYFYFLAKRSCFLTQLNFFIIEIYDFSLPLLFNNLCHI